MSAVLLGLSTCTGTSAVQVDVLEDEVARVVPLEGGPARTVPRRELPAGVREGDVVVRGQVDEEAGVRLRRQVAELRARLSAPVPDGLELDSRASGALTSGKER
jgi:hypothetical protein